MNSARSGRVLTLLTVSLIAAYPLLVYFLLDRGSVRLAGLALLLILAIRFTGSGSNRAGNRIFIATGGALAIALLLTDSELLARLYPVLVNVALLGAFGMTLVRPPSMIERMARLDGRALDEAGTRYTRNLTRVWCGFFAANAAIALATALGGSREVWALYNGLVSYILIGVLLVAERLIRPLLLRRHAAAAGR
ncbi:MAG: hypothetical protein IT480_04325 [Gammaproteobacteria bacterium]|nr:hypothetical protein [Gammaproteobacteria bacterium]